MIDLSAIRSSIIANASARQAGSETAKKLQIANDAQIYCNTMRSMSPLKARILFFSSSKREKTTPKMQSIASGSFFPLNGGSNFEPDYAHSNYESAVNLNGSNNVKPSNLDIDYGNNDIVSRQQNSLVNRG